MTTPVRQPPLLAARAQVAQRVLYIGPAADEMCSIVASHVGRVDIAYETDVQGAMMQARQRPFDVVLIDQRDDRLATRLIVPLLASLGYPLKLVVISSLQNVSQYLAIPGVARVLTAPVREGQLLRVLGLERRNRDVQIEAEPKPAQAAQAASVSKPKSLSQWLSDSFMSMVSTLYKRAAFVLLFTLFIAFAFYGALIGFFLLSSSWAAPLTLQRGHELVNKAERELTDLKVVINQTDQKLADAALAKVTAQRELQDANVVVKYALGTITKEIKSRERQIKTVSLNVKRLKKVKTALQGQLGSNGARADLQKLYNKRLIDKTLFNSGALGLIEASQRLAGIEAQLDDAQSQQAEFSLGIETLKALKAAMESGSKAGGIVTASNDLLLLTKQALDALSERDLASSKLASIAENEQSLGRSEQVLKEQLAALQLSPPVRAISKRIDVVFVPYGNEMSFTTGSALYTCRLTVLFCSKAGKVGAALPGEVSSVHPFFGKPIRGFFAEVTLDDENAATREVIHGRRKPFFL